MRRLHHLMPFLPISLLIACAGRVEEPVDVSDGAPAVGGTTSVGATNTRAGGYSAGGTHTLGGATSAEHQLSWIAQGQSVNSWPRWMTLRTHT